MRSGLLVCCLFIATAGDPSLAQTRAGVVQIDSRAEVAAALYAASVTQEASDRAANARLQAQAAEIGRLRREGRASRNEIAELEERYVAELAQRDSAYAQEIAVFRRAVEDIVSTPEGAAALAQFNAGNEVAAIGVLDRLVGARQRARQMRTNVEAAAERRRIASLALEARARGRLESQAVIARYVEVTELDPQVHWDWVELGRLYEEIGRTEASQDARARALALAPDANVRSIVAFEMGEQALEVGDTAAAQRFYAASLRDLGAGRGGSAVPTTSDYNETLIHLRLGHLYERENQNAEAEREYAQAELLIKPLADSPGASLSVLRAYHSALNTRARYEITHGSLASALELVTQAAAINQAAQAIAPNAPAVLQDLASTLELSAAILVELGEPTTAAQYLIDASSVYDRLISSDRDNMDFARACVLARIRLAEVTGSHAHWAAALHQLEAMHARGMLRQHDQDLLTRVREIEAATAH